MEKNLYCALYQLIAFDDWHTMTKSEKKAEIIYLYRSTLGYLYAEILTLNFKYSIYEYESISPKVTLDKETKATLEINGFVLK